jgi:hypothetical protein
VRVGSRSRGPEGREVTEQVKLDKLESRGNLLEWGGHEYVICRLLIKDSRQEKRKKVFFFECVEGLRVEGNIYRGEEFRNVQKKKDLGFSVLTHLLRCKGEASSRSKLCSPGSKDYVYTTFITLRLSLFQVKLGIMDGWYWSISSLLLVCI